MRNPSTVSCNKTRQDKTRQDKTRQDKTRQDKTRQDKVVIPNNTFQMASGQGSHWLIKSPTIFSSMCSPPKYLSILFLNIFTLLALTQSFGSLFYSFITLCEKEYFLMSNLHCSLTNAALCPLVLLPSLSLKNIFSCLRTPHHLLALKNLGTLLRTLNHRTERSLASYILRYLVLHLAVISYL